jgi:hypothetical protein
MFDVVLPYVVKKTIGFSSEPDGHTVRLPDGRRLIAIYLQARCLKKLGTKKLMRLGLYAEIILIMMVGDVRSAFRDRGAGRSEFPFLYHTSVFAFHNRFLFATWILMPVNVNIQKIVPNNMRSRFYSILTCPRRPPASERTGITAYF